jgi:hypothetical protein
VVVEAAKELAMELKKFAGKEYRSPKLLHLVITVLVSRSFTVKPNLSNSMERLLSVTNRRTEIRFLIMSGETRTLLRENILLAWTKEALPVAVMGKSEPLPTIIWVGVEVSWEGDDRIPASDVMCEVAPVSMYQSVEACCVRVPV